MEKNLSGIISKIIYGTLLWACITGCYLVLQKIFENAVQSYLGKLNVWAIAVGTVLVVCLVVAHSLFMKKELDSRKSAIDVSQRFQRHIQYVGVRYRHGITVENTNNFSEFVLNYEKDVKASQFLLKSHIASVDGLESIPATTSGLYFWMPCKCETCKAPNCLSCSILDKPLKEYIVTGPGIQNLHQTSPRDHSAPPPALTALTEGPFDIFDSLFLIFTSKTRRDFKLEDWRKLDQGVPKLVVFNCGTNGSIIKKTKTSPTDKDEFEINNPDEIGKHIKLYPPSMQTVDRRTKSFYQVDAENSQLVAHEHLHSAEQKNLKVKVPNIFCQAYNDQNDNGLRGEAGAEIVRWLKDAINNEYLAHISLKSLLDADPNHPKIVYCYYKILRKSKTRPAGFYLVSSNQIESIQSTVLGFVYSNLIQTAEADHELYFRKFSKCNTANDKV